MSRRCIFATVLAVLGSVVATTCAYATCCCWKDVSMECHVAESNPPWIGGGTPCGSMTCGDTFMVDPIITAAVAAPFEESGHRDIVCDESMTCAVKWCSTTCSGGWCVPMIWTITWTTVNYCQTDTSSLTCTGS